MDTTDSVRLVLTYNNTSISSETCPLCGGEAGRRIGGSNIPLEIFQADDLCSPVCPACAEKHAPELYEAQRAYYDGDFWRTRWITERAGLLHMIEEQGKTIGALNKFHKRYPPIHWLFQHFRGKAADPAGERDDHN